MSDAELARRALAKLELPPEPPRFFEELRERMREHDHAAARRWRRVSVVLAGVAVAAIATAVAFAASTLSVGGASKVVEGTISCPVRVLTKAHAVDVGAWTVTHNSALPASFRAAGIGVTTDPRNVKPGDPSSKQIIQLSLQSGAVNGMAVDVPFCSRSSRSVPLRPAGLPSAGTATPTFRSSFEQRCVTTARALIHYRVTEKGVVPVRAQVAVADDNPKMTPVAFVEWAPQRVTAFFGNSCVSSP